MARRQPEQDLRQNSEKLQNAIAGLKSALVVVDKADVPLAAAYTELAIFFCQEALTRLEKR